MITLEDRLHDTGEDLRRSAQQVPDRGMPAYRRAVPLRARWAIAALAVAALVALPIWLGAFDASTEDPALGGESMGDLQIMRGESDVIAFLDDTMITLDEALNLVEEIRQWEGVARVAYVSRDLALVEYRELFADQPSMVSIVESGPSILPSSIRLVLTDGADAGAIGARLRQIPGVIRTSASGEDTNPSDPTPGAQVDLVPIRVDCTSELAAFPCSALIDGDPTTSWRAPNGGIGAELTFYFEPAVQISHLTAENLRDECQFMRNARIRGFEVEINDAPWLRIQHLEDTNAQEIALDGIHTSRVVIKITSAHASSSCDGQEPFIELALQGVTFFGRVAPSD